MPRILSTVVVAFLLAGSPQGGVDGAALLKQVDRNLNPPSYESYKRIVNVEPGGRSREYLLYSINDGQEKVAALFLSPPADKNRSTLRLGENMWLFVPTAGKPVRITSLQSVVGGVFNNADILRIDYAAEYDVSSVDETASSEYVLQLKAKTRTVAYDRLAMRVARKDMLPVRIECLTQAGMLIKTLHFKDVKDFGNRIVRPSVIETDSPLQKGHRSVMTFVRIQPRTFPREVFTLAYMPNLESLRR